MKISFKHQAIEKKNGASCFVTEHTLNNEMLDIAIAKISGRYPETRRAINQQCDEVAYVFEGDGKIVINDQEFKLSAGDVVLVEAGDKFFWEGDMKLFISCRPAWKKDQHQMID